MSTTTAKYPAQNTRAAREASGEHLVSIMEVFARMKGNTDIYQREALIELSNLFLDTDTLSIL